MPRHWAINALLWIFLAPFRALGWALKEMGRQLVGKAKSVFAPLLWPTALILLFAVVYAIGGQQGLDHVLTILIVFGGLYVAFRMLLKPFGPQKKKKKK